MQTQTQKTFALPINPDLATSLQHRGRSVEVHLSQIAVSECVVITLTDDAVRITGNVSHHLAQEVAERADKGSDSVERIGSGMLLVRPDTVRLTLEERSFLLPTDSLRLVLEKLFPGRSVSIVVE